MDVEHLDYYYLLSRGYYYLLSTPRFAPQILCQCLGTSDPADQCLTSDRVSPAGPEFRQVSQEVLHNLELWWAAMMTSPGHDSAMSEQMYEELLAR